MNATLDAPIFYETLAAAARCSKADAAEHMESIEADAAPAGREGAVTLFLTEYAA